MFGAEDDEKSELINVFLCKLHIFIKNGLLYDFSDTIIEQNSTFVRFVL